MPSSHPQGIPEDAPSIGDGRYVLVARIGEGGMAGVYRTWDSRLRVWRAVKVLFPEYAKRRKLRQRFESEAHTMARLEHPNLVRIYDVGDAGPLPFIVMELVNGGTLIHWVARNGPMSPRMAVDVLLQVCRGVAEAHSAGVVHRDVKPQNVLISPSGRCKLTDFGIAQADEAGLTKTGSTMGTMGYMAPEQRNDAKSVDARADIYSLGATLWTLLVGEPAHDLFVAHDNPRLLEEVPEALRPVVLRSVTYNRNDRYPTVNAMISDLEGLLTTLPDDPPYAPDLVLDLTEEEPIENTPDFPEIRAILDGAAASFPPDPPSDETFRPPPGQKKALPYFMPSTDGEARRRGIVESRTSARSDDDLPDYIDRDSLDGGGDGFVISVDSAHVRDDPPPAAPTSTPDERLSYLDYEDDPPPNEDEAWDGLGDHLADHLADGPPEPEAEHKPPPARTPAPRPERSFVTEIPRTPAVAPPAPADDEMSPMARLASVASIPIGLFLAFSTLAVVVVMLVFGFNAYQLYGAATVANGSRQKLYTTLNNDRTVIEQLADLGGDRTTLEDAYLAWLEERGEPARFQAADRFLREVDKQSSELLAGEGSGAQRETEHVVRRIRSARMQYESDAAAWEERSSSLIGRALIFVGAGSGPPK